MLVKEFIEVVLLTEIEQMTIGDNRYANHPYVGFSLVITSIEILGACLDDEVWSKTGLSEIRFRLAIDELFPADYKKYNIKGGAYDLYSGLRCSLVHVLQPGSSISLSERRHEEAAGVKNVHLSIQDNKLLLIYEDLLIDFKTACEKTIKAIEEEKISNQK